MTLQWEVTYPLPTTDPCPLGATTPIGSGLWATLVLEPLPYVIAGLSPDLAEGAEALLERGRRAMARSAGLQVTPTVPKLAVVAAGPHALGDLAFRTRKGDGEGWHPGVAAGGLLALAVATAQAGSVPSELARGCASVVRVATGAGLRTIEFTLCPDLRPGVRIRLGAVQLDRERSAA